MADIVIVSDDEPPAGTVIESEVIPPPNPDAAEIAAIEEAARTERAEIEAETERLRIEEANETERLRIEAESEGSDEWEQNIEARLTGLETALTSIQQALIPPASEPPPSPPASEPPVPTGENPAPSPPEEPPVRRKAHRWI